MMKKIFYTLIFLISLALLIISSVGAFNVYNSGFEQTIGGDIYIGDTVYTIFYVCLLIALSILSIYGYLIYKFLKKK